MYYSRLNFTGPIATAYFNSYNSFRGTAKFATGHACRHKTVLMIQEC